MFKKGGKKDRVVRVSMVNRKSVFLFQEAEKQANEEIRFAIFTRLFEHPCQWIIFRALIRNHF